MGEELLGRVIDALGNPIDGKGPITTKTIGLFSQTLLELLIGNQFMSPCKQELRLLMHWFLLGEVNES